MYSCSKWSSDICYIGMLPVQKQLLMASLFVFIVSSEYVDLMI